MPPSAYYFDDGVYVGVGFSRLKKSMLDFDDPEDFYWARGMPRSARILYDPKGILKARIRRRKLKTPSHIREDVLWHSYHNIIEYSGKLRNGWLRKDEYLVRYAARIIAGRVQAALIALNDLSPISENIIWHQVLASKKKPAHLSTRLSGCHGPKGNDRHETRVSVSPPPCPRVTAPGQTRGWHEGSEEQLSTPAEAETIGLRPLGRLVPPLDIAPTGRVS